MNKLKKQVYVEALCDLYNRIYGEEYSYEQEFDILADLIEEYFKMIDLIQSGDLSDGYHTFNELYFHRAVLFSVICNQNKELAWKSKQHSDGTMFNNMFIVGIKTPKGQYSYHYDLDLWDMFKVKELEYAPEWDGHLPKDIDRLQSIDDNPPLKFEELEPNMWVWIGNKNGFWGKIYTIKNYHGKRVIQLYDGKYLKYGEDILPYDGNVFYRKQVE